jgi:hypothetical protein
LFSRADVLNIRITNIEEKSGKVVENGGRGEIRNNETIDEIERGSEGERASGNGSSGSMCFGYILLGESSGSSVGEVGRNGRARVSSAQTREEEPRTTPRLC